MDEPWTDADEVIEQVREVRRRISARFNHDPVRLVEHYMEEQGKYADRLVRREPRDRKPGAAA